MNTLTMVLNGPGHQHLHLLLLQAHHLHRPWSRVDKRILRLRYADEAPVTDRTFMRRTSSTNGNASR